MNKGLAAVLTAAEPNQNIIHWNDDRLEPPITVN